MGVKLYFEVTDIYKLPPKIVPPMLLFSKTISFDNWPGGGGGRLGGGGGGEEDVDVEDEDVEEKEEEETRLFVVSRFKHRKSSQNIYQWQKNIWSEQNLLIQKRIVDQLKLKSEKIWVRKNCACKKF